MTSTQHTPRHLTTIVPLAHVAVLPLLAVVLALISACSSEAPANRNESSLQQQDVMTPFDLPPDDPVTCPQATVVVTTAEQLGAALGNAAPGTVIAIADGTYQGAFTATANGTAQAPIWLCGSKKAVLRGPSINTGSVLHLQQVEHWRLVGFTIQEGKKGVMADGVTSSILQDLTVTDIGDEGVHLRSGSSGNLLRGLIVSDTGRRKEKFGEGIYVGTAESNWCQISSCGPDRSDANLIVGSTISGTAAEAIDIKEGTTGGLVKDNAFDGANMRAAADSWVDVKGNDWLVQDNRGTSSRGSGFQTHQVVEG